MTQRGKRCMSSSAREARVAAGTSRRYVLVVMPITVLVTAAYHGVPGNPGLNRWHPLTASGKYLAREPIAFSVRIRTPEASGCNPSHLAQITVMYNISPRIGVLTQSDAGPSQARQGQSVTLPTTALSSSTTPTAAPVLLCLSVITISGKPPIA